mmetsp:Transcript_41412/g.77091  ORF Transcript_41412/g.77091 Transcript_41412/m.77091 type:complete len:922 (+) Transcript_41412:65-2830(+)
MITNAQWMWVDSWNDPMARLNPLRWEKAGSYRALLQRLDSQRCSRPLRIVVEIQGRLGKDRIEKEFESPELAVQWLRNGFGEPTEPGGSQEGSGAPTSVGEGSWRSSAGRSTGPNGYQFGDVTRTLLAKTKSCSKVVQKEEREVIVPTSEEADADHDVAIEHDLAAPGGLDMANSSGAHDSEPGLPTREDVPDAQEVTSVWPENDAALSYMWADAGLLPGLAQANPLRWSPAMTPLEALKDLDAFPVRERPVKLKVTMPGHHEMKTFESIDSALQWIRTQFNISQTEHKCVICLEAQVSVMLVPCRHAVLCDDCAEPILSGSGTCPICRVHITNHARGHFTDDYVDLVHAMEARMESTQAAAYEGMYNNIRPLMVTGALLGTGAAACFVLAAPAAIPLAGAALAVGYLPWFATTVAHFESESEAGSQLAAASVFSRADLSRPLTLIAKAVTMAVAVPFAALVFFIPYGLFAGVLRPLARGLVHGLVRLCAYAHVYAVCPTIRNLQILSRHLLTFLRATGHAGWEQAVILGNLLAQGGRKVGDALNLLAQHLHVMAVRGGEAVAHGAGVMHENVFTPIGQGMQHGARVVYSDVMCPGGRRARAVARHVAAAAAAAARATYNNVLVPSAHALQQASRKVGIALATGATSIYTYVLLPSGRAMVLVLRRSRDGILTAAEAVYSYILVPMFKGVVATAHMLHDYVLVPLGQATLKGLKLLGNGMTVSAEFIYRNVLVPLGSGTWAALRALGSGAAWGLRALGNGLAFGASLTYQYFLLPCAYGVALVAYGTWRGACVATASLYAHALVPTGQVIAAGARTAYVYIIAPSGRALYTAGAATAEAVKSLGSALAQHCVAGGQNVYAYVLLPTGQTICVAASASAEAVQTGYRAGRDAACSASTSVRQAIRESVQAMQASTQSFMPSR